MTKFPLGRHSRESIWRVLSLNVFGMIEILNAKLQSFNCRSDQITVIRSEHMIVLQRNWELRNVSVKWLEMSSHQRGLGLVITTTVERKIIELNRFIFEADSEEALPLQRKTEFPAGLVTELFNWMFEGESEECFAAISQLCHESLPLL